MLLVVGSLEVTGAYAKSQVMTKVLEYPPQEPSQDNSDGQLLLREEEK